MPCPPMGLPPSPSLLPTSPPIPYQTWGTVADASHRRPRCEATHPRRQAITHPSARPPSAQLYPHAKPRPCIITVRSRSDAKSPVESIIPFHSASSVCGIRGHRPPRPHHILLFRLLPPFAGGRTS